MKRLRNFAIGLGYLGLLLMVPTVSAAFKYLHEGMEAPEFSGIDVRSGASIEIDKLVDNGVVVVLFWSTWSNRSLEQLHDMADLYVNYKDLPVSFLAINVEGQHVSETDRGNIAAIANELPPGISVLIDDGLEIFYQFGVIAVPSTAVLDKTGSLRYGPAGYSLKTRDLIVDSIEVLLGIREATADSVIAAEYEPDPTASRYFQLARNLYTKRMYERALDNVVNAIDADSGFAAPYCLRGDIYLMTDSLGPAKTSYEKALLCDSTSIIALTGLGESLRRSGETDSATVVLSRGLSFDSTYTPCLQSLALCLSAAGDAGRALDLIESALSLNPNDATTLYYRARVAREAAQPGLSVESYLRALELLYPPPSF